MKKKSNSTTTVNIAEYALKRDKEIACREMRAYFVTMNRQEKAWHLSNAVKNSLSKNIFSTAEVQKMTKFLAGKFGIRQPTMEYAQAVSSSTTHCAADRKTTQADAIRGPGGENVFFVELYLRLQAGVQENLLDYNGAFALVHEIITRYPKARASLPR